MLTLHIPEQTDSFTLYVKGTILFSKVKNFNIRFKSKYYYAVASSSAHGDRFGTFGGQSIPRMPIPNQDTTATGPGPNMGMGMGMNTGAGTGSGTGTANSMRGSTSGPSRGPSPDMTPIANLATAGVLQDDPSLVTETRWHKSSTPAFPPATTGNPPPGPLGTYGSPSSQGPERIDPRDTPSFRAVDGLIEGFRTSFPRDLRDPVAGGRVDSELYVACLVPHVYVFFFSLFTFSLFHFFSSTSLRLLPVTNVLLSTVPLYYFMIPMQTQRYLDVNRRTSY